MGAFGMLPMAFVFNLIIYIGVGQTSPRFFCQRHQFILLIFNMPLTFIFSYEG